MSKVFINAGRGGRDYGLSSATGRYEKEYNLAVALALRDILKKYGIEICLNREVDTDSSSAQNVCKCNLFAPDICVAIETNRMTSIAGRGFSTVVAAKPGDKSRILGYCIDKHVAESGIRNNGVSCGVGGYDRYTIIREVFAPTVVCRCMYIDNPDDAVEFNADAYAHPIAKAILEYFGIEYRKEMKYIKLGPFDEDEINSVIARLSSVGIEALDVF